MVSFKQFLVEDVYNLVYHVTLTSSVPSIRKKGLLHFQTSNWVQASNRERYGGGELFAFENLKDAIRWAARMDWEFNHETGSGKISILTIKDTRDWDEDDSDPFSQAGAAGRWLKRIGVVKPQDIVDIIPVTREVIKKLQQ